MFDPSFSLVLDNSELPNAQTKSRFGDVVEFFGAVDWGNPGLMNDHVFACPIVEQGENGISTFVNDETAQFVVVDCRPIYSRCNVR